ncbi:MAG TPA: bifunctional DNA primase/polymerase, partial [Acidimicrobiia bacterium]
MTNNQKLEAALRYASWGWHVLPLQPNSKIPATAHGVHDATVDPEQIRKWWSRDPEMNIGVAAGRVSDLLVFDVDPRNGGEQGWEEWTGA